MDNQKKYSAVILGGGIAGISTALELARLGQEVALVEKTPFFGGRAAHFCCKATDACQKCGACLVEERLSALFHEPRVTLMPNTELAEVSRDHGTFHLRLMQQPEVVSLPTDKTPELVQPAKSIELTADAVVVATGYRPSDPLSRPHYGYDRLANMITGFELEEMLRNGKKLQGPGGELPRRVAFIHCVGSRDKNHPYCSQVCCAYTLRLARLLKHRIPEVEVTSFYMDLQEIGRISPQFQAEARRELKVLRVMPSDPCADPDGRIKLRYLEEVTGRPAEVAFDLVVLAVGISPGEDNAALAALLQTELTPDGFFQAADPLHRSQTSQPGLFLAGTAAGPRDIAGCIAQAAATARQVSQYVKER
jgi:heterodisulfide reductase subunit A